jgi:DNA (cytosine-5)-methyltransferase 1
MGQAHQVDLQFDGEMSLDRPAVPTTSEQSLDATGGVERPRPEPISASLGAYEKQLPEPRLIDVVDFFAGCGGMSAGFMSTRQSHVAFSVLGGVDIDEAALLTYEQNIRARTLRMDVKKLAAQPETLLSSFPELGKPRVHPLVFIGCAPCQGFSALRKGDDRDDTRNALLSSFVSLVIRFRPDVLVMENVPEMLSGRFAKYYRQSASRLKRAGYTLSESIVDMSLYGVPQRRKRAIVLGSVEGAVRLVEPPFAPNNAPTVRHAIAHLPPLKAGEIDPDDENHRAPSHTQRLLSLFEKIPPDGGDRRAIPEALQIAAHKRLDKSLTPGFTDVYGRLRWDTPSVTITAKSRSPSSGRFLHPEQHRNITVREAALLQGFPHKYVFCGPPTQQYRQVGEAVPPLFARFVAASILNHLNPISSRTDLSVTWGRNKRLRDADERLERFCLIDAFCGAGGLSLGFANAGLAPSFAFDADADAVGTFNKNLVEVAQVADISAKTLSRSASGAASGRQVIVVGGPPCQGFSHQRKGEADDPRNHLVLRFADFIEALSPRPIAVVLENVTDLELPRGIHILRQFVSRMEGLGLVPHRHVLNAADFGTAQLRRRVIMVFLQPAAAAKYTGPLPTTAQRWLTVGEAWAGLPRVEESAEVSVQNHTPSIESAENRRRIAFVDMGAGRRAIPQWLQLPCHAGDYRGHRDVYGRMDWFLPARTITGGLDSFTRGEFAHPFQHRSITHREGARLQGFPDWFAFTGNRAATRRQIGNAVPPGMACAVAKAVLHAVERAQVHGKPN